MVTPWRAELPAADIDPDPGPRVDAAAQVQRGAGVAGPQRVPPVPVPLPPGLDLLDAVHGEPPRPVQPQLIAGAPVQRQERQAVARGAVAEAGPLAQRDRKSTRLNSSH